MKNKEREISTQGKGIDHLEIEERKKNRIEERREKEKHSNFWGGRES